MLHMLTTLIWLRKLLRYKNIILIITWEFFTQKFILYNKFKKTKFVNLWFWQLGTWYSHILKKKVNISAAIRWEELAGHVAHLLSKRFNAYAEINQSGNLEFIIGWQQANRIVTKAKLCLAINANSASQK